jgi:hypothetical protein
MTQNSGPGGSRTRWASHAVELFEPELVHARFAAFVAFAVADEQ